MAHSTLPTSYEPARASRHARLLTTTSPVTRAVVRAGETSRRRQTVGKLLALLCAVVLAAGAGCSGGAEPGDDDGTSGLVAFLSGTGPELLEPVVAVRYGELLARHAVRANGYTREGVVDAGADGWSPIVRESTSGAQPADVTPWVAAGDIDDTGRFAPCTRPCPPSVRPTAPPSGLALAGIEERVARVRGAVTRLVGREVEIAWAPLSARAILVPVEGPVLVNPRLLQLVIPTAPVQPPATGAVPGAAAPVAEERAARPDHRDVVAEEIPSAAPAVPGVERASEGPQEWGDGMQNIKNPCDKPCDKACDCSFRPRGGPASGTGLPLVCTLTALAALVVRRRRLGSCGRVIP